MARAAARRFSFSAAWCAAFIFAPSMADLSVHAVADDDLILPAV